MKHLNEKSATIFCQLLDRLNGTEYLKIENEPYMPLSMERVGDNEASLYSILHYYTQCGDLMRDPEVGFIVVDNRTDTTKEVNNVQITPYLFRQDNLGIYQESIILRDGVAVSCNDDEQHDLAAFTDDWLCNIEVQGFLNV